MQNYRFWTRALNLVFIYVFTMAAGLCFSAGQALGAPLDATAKSLYISFEQFRSQEQIPSEKTKAIAEQLVPLLLKAGKAQEAIWVLNRAGESALANRLETMILGDLTSGKIVEAGPIRHTGSGPAFVRFESGLIAIAKAELRSSTAHSVYAEYWTYLLSKYLGLNTAPITVLRKIDGYMFSFQIYVPESKESNRDFRMNHELDVPWLWTLDRLTGQVDRNAANSLVTLSGHYIGIDNEQAASFAPKDPVMAMQTWQAQLRSSTPEQTSVFTQLFKDPESLSPEFRHWASHVAPRKIKELFKLTEDIWSPEIQSAIQVRTDEFLRATRDLNDQPATTEKSETRVELNLLELKSQLASGLKQLSSAHLMVPTSDKQLVEFILPETKLKSLIRQENQSAMMKYVQDINRADPVWLLQLPIPKIADLLSAYVDENPKSVRLLDLMYENEIWFEELVRLDPRFKIRIESDPALLQKVTKVMMNNWRRAPQFLGRFLMPPNALSAESVEYIFQQFVKNQMYMQIEMLLRIPVLKNNAIKYAGSFQLLSAEIRKRKLKPEVLQLPEWALPTLTIVHEIRCELVLK